MHTSGTHHHPMESSNHHKKIKTDVAEDRISNLPNCIIHHIFSFLDTQYAVRTSVLSTRWRYLCTSLPFLNFDSSTASIKDKKGSFTGLVDDVLFFHDRSNIDQFVLHHSGSNIPPQPVYRWTIALVRHNVQELDLTFSCKTLKLPHRLFTSKSLIKLKLSIDIMRGKDYYKEEWIQFDLPGSMSLPHLKSLHLERLRFMDDKLTCKLFESCPALESLTIAHCQVKLLSNLTITALKLKHLSISIASYAYEGSNAFKIKIDAPSLNSFEYHDRNSVKDYQIEGFPDLENACIGICVSPEKFAHMKNVYTPPMVKFLNAVRNVKALTLSRSSLQFLSGPPALINSLTMQFYHLRNLKLEGWISRDSALGIMRLLEMSPNIENLCIDIVQWPWSPVRYQMNPYLDEKSSHSEYYIKYWERRSSAPFMLNHLKVVQMHDVQGSVDEVVFLEILLETAIVLEKLAVYVSKREFPFSEGRLLNFKQKLLKLNPRPSSMEILFF